jgi:predicted ATPase
MIALRFLKPHRSIFVLPSVELPDFAVITGINGSGKSHLLEAIKNGAIRIDGVEANDADMRLFNWTNLVPAEGGLVDPIQLGKARSAYLDSIADRYAEIRRKFITDVSGLNLPFISLVDVDAVLNIGQEKFFELQKNQDSNRWKQFSHILNTTHTACLGVGGNNPIARDLLVECANLKGKPLASLTSQDIYEAFPLNWSPVDMFQQNFSQIFARYHKAWEDNRYNRFVNETYSEQNPHLSDIEFVKRYGEPPWGFVNRLLQEARLDYRITNPSGRADIMFEAKLVNKTSHAEISFQDLSSGEKIIMSFALCVYYANDRIGRARYPKLLLFDEVDAPLNPSMTKDIVRIIKNVLVAEKGIKVILTTHSPATVAFSSEGSLFRLDKQPRALIPCTRDQAVQFLTSGYISVTDGSRFVITESQQDRLVYNSIFRKLVERNKLPESPNLIFIQASDKKDKTGGGRQQVRNWSDKLPAAGLNQIFGLIDRDNNNVASATVKVIRRHSLENYLLDPIVLYAVLMHRGEHVKFFDAGLKDGNYFELRSADQPTLQRIADAVCTYIAAHQPAIKNASGVFEITYISGKAIFAPAWLRECRGHDLETAVRDAFRAKIGNAFVITQNDCADLIDMLSERLPEFVPTDLVEVFRDLQST